MLVILPNICKETKQHLARLWPSPGCVGGMLLGKGKRVNLEFQIQKEEWGQFTQMGCTTSAVLCSTPLLLPVVRGRTGAASLLQPAGMVWFGSLSQWTSERVNYGQSCVNHFRWRRRWLWLMPRIYWAEVKSVCVFQCGVTYRPFQLQGTTQHKGCFFVMLTSDDESFSFM